MNDDRVALEELADRLRDERRIVTLLLYELTVSRLLLGADERGFAAAALREADRAMELLHDDGRDLIGCPHGLAADIDADAERRQATLRALARALPPSLVSFLR